MGVLDQYDVISMAKITKMKSVFSQINFPYALIKGDALSIQIYGKPGMRSYGDIDILIDRSNLKKIKAILASEGFLDTSLDRKTNIIMLSQSHQVSPWIKDISMFGILEVDLNLDIYWGEHNYYKTDIDEFLNDTIEVPIYGVNIKVLPPTKALLQLLLHHYKDINSIYLLATRKTIKADKFMEIYRLLRNNIQYISTEALYDLCQKYNALPYAYYMLYYTNCVIKDDHILPKYISALYSKEGHQLLNCYGLTEKERKQWKFDFDTRLKANDELSLIKQDLTVDDFNKIHINKRMMMIE